MIWETDNKSQKEIEVQVDTMLRKAKRELIETYKNCLGRITKTEIIKDAKATSRKEKLYMQK